jgi:hypothetical protein
MYCDAGWRTATRTDVNCVRTADLFPILMAVAMEQTAATAAGQAGAS